MRWCSPSWSLSNCVVMSPLDSPPVVGTDLPALTLQEVRPAEPDPTRRDRGAPPLARVRALQFRQALERLGVEPFQLFCIGRYVDADLLDVMVVDYGFGYPRGDHPGRWDILNSVQATVEISAPCDGSPLGRHGPGRRTRPTRSDNDPRTGTLSSETRISPGTLIVAFALARRRRAI